MSRFVYMDNSATTQVKKEVLDEMLPYFSEKFGNPSSVYSLANKSRMGIEKARVQVARAIGAENSEIYFTASGTEADNWLVKGLAYINKKKGNHIITCKIEHHAILHTCQQLEEEGFEVTYLDVDEFGLIDLEKLKDSIKDTTILITIMFANNEIGTIQPIKEVGQIAKEKNIYFHTDAVQAIGHVRIDVKELNIDALSLSAHKFHGPKGVGALYLKKGIRIEPMLTGGAQERRMRGGTENVPGIVGMGKAIEIAYEDLEENNLRLISMRDRLIDKIEKNIKHVKLNGHRTKRLPNNVNFSFEFIEGQSLLLNLDLVGICASSGSACSSGSLEPSHVLMAIGLPHEIARGSLRLSLGDFNTEDEIDYVVENLKNIVARLRRHYDVEE